MKKLVVLCCVLVVFSCDDIIEVEDISGESVTVLAPTEGTILNNTTISFSWNAVLDAEHYRFEIATPTFQNATQIVVDTTITTTSFTTTLNADDYQWRVRAENSDYKTTYTTQSFAVDTSEQINISNEPVVLLAPANGVVFIPTDAINFSWETVSGADNYTIQIATPDFENAVEVVENEATTNLVFSVSSLEAGNYEWRVKANNSNYETNYTAQNFTVEE